MGEGGRECPLENYTEVDAIFSGGEGGIRISSPRGDPWLKKTRHFYKRSVSSGGEGGSSTSSYPEEPILLPPGTPVKEALLIIRFRLDAKGDLDSM